MYATNVYQVLTTTVNGSTTVSEGEITGTYRNDPKFSDRLVLSVVQTQIRLILEEQSDQGLHCLLFHLHHFDKIPLRFGLFV